MFEVLIVVAFIIAGIVLYAAGKPSEFQIQRSLAIKASPEKLFALITDLKQAQTWSAWEKVDPGMQRSYSEQTGGVGAHYTWKGNREVGEGSITVVETIPFHKVGWQLDFIKPFKGQSRVEFTLSPSGEDTVVTHTMRGSNSLIPKIMCILFFNQEKMIGGKFEEGLANLKKLAEQ